MEQLHISEQKLENLENTRLEIPTNQQNKGKIVSEVRLSFEIKREFR